ncbi:alpha/beta hydrolase [Aeoliella sp. SH292]|uniref:alpha/beta hydrolase n=1 Tax=Aeoliella sp. SH292 TaxID=3454464 RepID=UPI003F9B79EE
MLLRYAIVLVLVGIGFPAQAEEELSPKIQPDVVYGHKDGLAMTFDVHRPEKEANGAAILFVVSGGWYSIWTPPEQLRPMFAPFLDQGYTVLAVRHGSSPRYKIPEAVDDLQRAVRYVRLNAEELGVDADRLGVMGMSAGGHLSLMLGTTGDDGDAKATDPVGRESSRVQAVVALVPPTDLRVAVWEAPESLPEYRRFPALDMPLEEAGEQSPLTQVTADDAPSLVMMGGKDDLVPPRHGEWIDAAFEKAGVERRLVVLPDAGHNLFTPGNAGEVQGAMVEWFDKHLAAEPK